MNWMLVNRIAALALTACASTVQAGVIFSYSGGFLTSGSQSSTYGFEFTPVQNITVDALGFFDAGRDGLSRPHRVGIWTAGGALLASTAVSTANSVLAGAVFNGGQFRFTGISALDLLSGVTYRFGAAAEASSDAWYFGGVNIAAAPTLASVSATGFFQPEPFSFPSENIGNTYGIGSFRAHVTGQVPEPATLVLLGVGLAGLGWIRRCKPAGSRAPAPGETQRGET